RLRGGAGGLRQEGRFSATAHLSLMRLTARSARGGASMTTGARADDEGFQTGCAADASAAGGGLGRGGGRLADPARGEAADGPAVDDLRLRGLGRDAAGRRERVRGGLAAVGQPGLPRRRGGGGGDQLPDRL